MENRLRFLLLDRGTGHLVNVFGCFVLDDPEDVVNRDDTRQPVAHFDHRNGHEVVLFDDVRDLFLVGFDRHRDDVGGHDVAEQRGWASRDHPPHPDKTQKRALFVDHVDCCNWGVLGYGT